MRLSAELRSRNVCTLSPDREQDPIPDRFGLLIYTASAGAQGTLGGLVEISSRMPFEIIEAAIERMRLCSSNDPVCADP